MHPVKIWKPALDTQEIPEESDTNHPVSKGQEPRKDNIPKHSFTSWSKGVAVLLCSALVWPHLGHSGQFWTPQYKRDSIREHPKDV